MCELLAISASAPVDVKLSLSQLAQHGGMGGHPDGWGVAFTNDRDAQVWRDPRAASNNPWVACLNEHPVTSRLVLAHIRRATMGGISLANTQPFVRELWGRVHIFAHNGKFPGLDALPSAARFQPLGETDSERAFCAFLDAFARESDAGEAALFQFLELARRLRELGPANFLYASANRLLVHADRRTQLSGEMVPPGLWLLRRECNTGDTLADEGSPAVIAGEALKVAAVASVPLTDEAWEPLPRGTILEISAGVPIFRAQI